MTCTFTLLLATVTIFASCALADPSTNATFFELVNAALSNVNAPDGLNAACLGCFCRDNLNTDCSNAVWSELNDHYGDDVYGFDYDYWHATQDPTATAANGGTNLTMNYADCRRDLDCATQTVVKYLTMHTKKCLDAALEKPACLDYAIIQFNGVMGCTVPAPQKGRWNQLNDCLAAN